MKLFYHPDYGYPNNIKEDIILWCFKYGLDNYKGPVAKSTINSWIRSMK